MNELTTPSATLSPAALYGMWLRGYRSAGTRRNYDAAARDFAGFLRAESANVAAESLLGMTRFQANATVEAYKAHLVAAGQADATVALKVSALRSLVELAERCGLCGWTLDVRPPEVQALRDTKGLSPEAFRTMLAACGDGTLKASRDRAMLRLMWDLGLRGESSVLAMDRADVDLPGGRVWVHEKGKAQKVPKTLAEPTRKAIQAWLLDHPNDHPALFVNLDNVAERGRLSGQSLRKLVTRLATLAGVKASTHDFRRGSATTALDRTNGNVREVQSFLGHANPKTTMVYDTNRQDFAGKISRLVADE